MTVGAFLLGAMFIVFADTSNYQAHVEKYRGDITYQGRVFND